MAEQSGQGNFEQYINVLKECGYTVFKPKRAKNDPESKAAKTKLREQRKAMMSLLKQKYAPKRETKSVKLVIPGAVKKLRRSNATAGEIQIEQSPMTSTLDQLTQDAIAKLTRPSLKRSA